VKGSRLDRFRDPALLATGALAVHRLTRLLTEDEVTSPARARVRRWAEEDGHDGLAYLLTCPWCVSVYVAAAWAVLTATAPAVAAPAGAALAWSSAAGLLSSLE
jgi:uncharacterized protein DUF1360